MVDFQKESQAKIKKNIASDILKEITNKFVMYVSKKNKFN